MKTLIKSIVVSIFFVSIFSSCQKENIEPEKPYTCFVTSTGIDADVFLNNKKQEADSIVQENFSGISTTVYYYSFGVESGDKLSTSFKNNPDITTLSNYQLASLGVGYQLKNDTTTWQQLYFINFCDYNGDGDSEGYNFTIPFTTDEWGAPEGVFVGQDLDGDYIGDTGVIEPFTHIF